MQADRTLSPAALAALQRLLALFGVHMLLADLGDFLEDGYLSGAQAGALRDLQYTVRLCCWLLHCICIAGHLQLKANQCHPALSSPALSVMEEGGIARSPALPALL